MIDNDGKRKFFVEEERTFEVCKLKTFFFHQKLICATSPKLPNPLLSIRPNQLDLFMAIRIFITVKVLAFIFNHDFVTFEHEQTLPRNCFLFMCCSLSILCFLDRIYQIRLLDIICHKMQQSIHMTKSSKYCCKCTRTLVRPQSEKISIQQLGM